MAQEETAKKPEEAPEEEGGKKFELFCGLILAFFAAILAVTDLGGGKYGGDEQIAHSEKSNGFSWYQAKAIKQTLVEGQRDLLKTLLEAGAINEDKAPAIKEQIEKLDGKAKRYDKEKAEILKGSSKLDPKDWAQETIVDGKPVMGQIIGADEWKVKADLLNDVGDTFDFATLFLQICLVMGAISLVLQNDKVKWGFLFTMLTLGSIGVIYSAIAYNMAFAVP